MNEDSTCLTRELNQRLAKLTMIYRRKLISDYAPYGLPVSSIVVIQAIAQGADTPSKIADMLNQTRQHVALVLKTLEYDGYIHREVNEKDGRRVDVSLSESGRNMLHHISEAQVQRLAPFADALSAEELSHFSAQLATLVEKLDEP